jgi:heme/copper-type cytochrome/quinol oxidase subunit 2
VNNQKLEIQTSNRWWQWVILAALGLVVLFVPISVGATAPTERTFRIEASRFEYSPAILSVNPGDHVTIELVATDVVHGLSIDGYNLETTADPGKTARLTFVANREGSFRFHCTTTCGNLHPFMIGKLEVGQNTLLWRAIALTGLALFVGVWMGRK